MYFQNCIDFYRHINPSLAQLECNHTYEELYLS